ncbi:hypothetical protein DI272_10280 [Streptomyces sp. Act143]|uniref:SWIM zinc finger family protein n=1 Tax=Streptomyces sp. Act143 TaxID=2200760 RepID=UPI000D6791BB|nr:SWIM zinc finger family protein [Streptomyces sp. Act143]PWI14494.1 hypothetical protein DI272_10280 [Streptomyces sp. Act143]
MSPGPADEARRALREAREARQAQAAQGAQERKAVGEAAPGPEGPEGRGIAPGGSRPRGESVAPGVSVDDEAASGAVGGAAEGAGAAEKPTAEQDERPRARPGDAARAALRRAMSERRGAAPHGPATGGGTEPGGREGCRQGAPDEEGGDRSERGTPPGVPASPAPPSTTPPPSSSGTNCPSSATTPPPHPLTAAPLTTTPHAAAPHAAIPLTTTPLTAIPHTTTPLTAAPHTTTPHATAPRHPRSMAAPGRDGELRRTFPAFAPRAADGEHGFAETWWGNAWVRALEEGALDAKRLARGRSYAEQGNVDAITVTPGLVLAYVQGSRPRPYRVQVRLRTLDDTEWQWFLDAAAERPGHIAALLDKEMPHSLAEGGVRLLPGPGELAPHCSCPDRGHPCKHAAALCYQTARLLDADPFVLLLLRGRGERELLDTLSRLSAARAARAAQEKGPAPLPGVRATEALAPRQLPPLPAPLPAPAHPEQPPVYPAAPGGPDPFALDQLATDAAARAHALLTTGRDPVADLTLWQDAVRLAAARPGSGLTAATRSLYASLASAADRTPSDLARAVAAWRQGGYEGLAVLEEPWDPPAGRFDRARPLLLAADLPAFRPWRNRLTHPRGHVQLRLGRDGLWYAYESDPGADDWWPRGTPDLDPVGALTGLGASPDS